MSTTTTMIAPSPGQTFSGDPSGQNYTADANGIIANVQAIDVLPLVKAGCQFQNGSVPVLALTASGAQALAFAAEGDIEYRVTLAAACALSITQSATGTGVRQRLTVRIIPVGYQATLPASTAALVNAGGAPPVPSTTAITEYTYVSDGFAPILGGV